MTADWTKVHATRQTVTVARLITTEGPPRFRYLDNPHRNSVTGAVILWPMVTIDVPGSRFYLRLHKRRLRCTTCHHRHGPSRNNPAKVCCARTNQRDGRWIAPACGCALMTDWDPPEVMLGHDKAAGPGRQLMWGQRNAECAYCGHDVVLNDAALASDEPGWAARAREHQPSCEWVVTRGHSGRSVAPTTTLESAIAQHAAEEAERDTDNVGRIRAGLRSWPRIKFQCFNRAEVDRTAALLTPEERDRVIFTWLRHGP